MKYLITGVTGSLGKAVCEKLVEDPENQVTGYSRDEFKQAAFPKHKNLNLYLGDIRDVRRLTEASRGIDVIFHFAALKHVDQLEMNPEEAILTNVIGTEHVLHAQRINHIPRVVMASTDKSVYPVNVYGMSKGIAERLVLRNPNNVVCRYGNVLASRGSFIESLVKTLKKDKVAFLTDLDMNRFWLTVTQAADFVRYHDKGPGGLKIPKMKAADLNCVLLSVVDILGIKEYDIELIGKRPGEKIFECLQSSYEGEEIFSHTGEQYTKEELTELLRPIVESIV